MDLPIPTLTTGHAAGGSAGRRHWWPSLVARLVGVTYLNLSVRSRQYNHQLRARKLKFVHESLSRQRDFLSRLVSMTLLNAIGTIGPQSDRLAPVEAALAELHENPHSALCPSASNYPAQCIDGRPAESDHPSLPRSAGGTLTTWVVDFLLTGVMAPPANTMYEDGFAEMLSLWLDNVCRTLAEAGLPVSDHRDNHSSDSKSGCGAADGLGAILTVLGERPEGLDALLTSWGIDPEDVPPSVVLRAREVAGVVPIGTELIPIIERNAQNPIPILHGAHGETSIVANTVEGQTLSQDAVPLAGTQAFGVDLWALPRIADFLVLAATRAGYVLSASTKQIVATAAAFNAAALLVLCSPEMPTVVLREK